MPDQEIEIQYDSLDAVPEAFRSLYDEKDGKAVLAGVRDLKTSADIANLQEALRKEREDHRKAQDMVKPWQGFGKPEELQAKLDRIAELEAAAGGKLDEEAINKIAEGRVQQKVAPLERDMQKISGERDTLMKQVEALTSAIDKRDRDDAVRSVALEMKVHTSAIEDILMVAGNYFEKTDDGKFIVKPDAQGVTPGSDIKGFMKEMQSKRPHWWPQSEGGGAGGGGPGGGGGKNPWSADGWNVTEQMNIYRSQGADVANHMAKSAGTTVGGARPQKKN